METITTIFGQIINTLNTIDLSHDSIDGFLKSPNFGSYILAIALVFFLFGMIKYFMTNNSYEKKYAKESDQYRILLNESWEVRERCSKEMDKAFKIME